MIVNDPKRSGKCCTCGIKFIVAFFVNNKGVPISIVNPIIHKINRTSGIVMADIIHIIADRQNPKSYRVVKLFAEGTCFLSLMYSITRIIHITAYESANHSEFLRNPSVHLLPSKQMQ